MILGIVSALVPFMGFQDEFRSLIVFVLGLAISVIAYLIYRERQTFIGPVEKSQPVLENKENTQQSNNQ